MILTIIELIAFILPAIPKKLEIRLLILFLYFVAHYFQLNNIYKKYKNNLKCN